MRDAVFLVDYVDDRDAAEGSEVEGLSAGAGVERGAVEVDFLPVRGDHDAGLKLVEVGIGVVEAFGHGDIAIVPERPGADEHVARGGGVG